MAGKRVFLPVLILCLLMTLALGCGRRDTDAASGAQTQSSAASLQQGQTTESGMQTAGEEMGSRKEEQTAEEDPGGSPEDPEAVPSGEQDQELPIEEDGVYTHAEDVALYLHTYGVLPSNFMTKKEARALGWNGGSLEEYAPGMCIGGDRFGNYEGVLPEGNYHECDIDTLGRSKRGARRLVYDDRGNIYYTEDHYESFELLFEGD